VNDLLGQRNAMRVVQTLEALRKVAHPSSGGMAAAAVSVGGGGDHIGDSKPPRSTMERKAESFIPATAAMTETSTPDSFIVKDTSGVMDFPVPCFSLVSFFVVDCFIALLF